MSQALKNQTREPQRHTVAANPTIQNDNDGDEEEPMWKPTIDDTAEEEPIGDRKMTSDDLAQFMSQRQSRPVQHPVANPTQPPPTPLDD